MFFYKILKCWHYNSRWLLLILILYSKKVPRLHRNKRERIPITIRQTHVNIVNRRHHPSANHNRLVVTVPLEPATTTANNSVRREPSHQVAEKDPPHPLAHRPILAVGAHQRALSRLGLLQRVAGHLRPHPNHSRANSRRALWRRRRCKCWAVRRRRHEYDRGLFGLE